MAWERGGKGKEEREGKTGRGVGGVVKKIQKKSKKKNGLCGEREQKYLEGAPKRRDFRTTVVAMAGIYLARLDRAVLEPSDPLSDLEAQSHRPGRMW